MGKGVHPVLFKVSEYQGKDTVAILELLNRQDSQLLANAGGKGKALVDAMAAAVAYLEKELGKSMAGWKWGLLHSAEFPHPMAIKKPLDRVFNAGPIPMHGDTDTVCQSSMQPDNPYQANLACPSYRQIVDLEDFGRSLWVKPPGQSGQLGSPNYADKGPKELRVAKTPKGWRIVQEEMISSSKWDGQL